jgi:hypothetical protein
MSTETTPAVAPRFPGEPPRSDKWPAVEHAHLKLQPLCQCCKNPDPSHKVQVHHMFPFHYCVALGRPDLELDQRNLITLCESEKDAPCDNHHLLVGHLDDFQSSNMTVEDDAKITFFGMSHDAIITDPRWIQKKSTRLKPLSQFTQDDKNAFIEAMNSKYPLITPTAPVDTTNQLHATK